jgi:phosphoribosylformimino-5-aminoimidazole carboxamide ribotide isomerase
MRTVALERVIPVMDLRGGEAVWARGGRRADYCPLNSPLCPSSRPEAVVSALLGRHAFSAFYVADLDAIQGRGDHFRVIERLRARFRRPAWWVDAGIASAQALAEWQALGLGRAVIGSESLTDVKTARALLRAAGPEGVLSLDFLGERFLGPPELLEDPGCWPREVIVMALDRVGTGRGPDYQRLRTLLSAAPDRHFYAAGGVRSAEDLSALTALGVSGALIASALHDGRI